MCRLRALVLLGALLASACSTYRDQLARGQHAFDQNDHDRALAILRDLERDVKRLTAPEQAGYAYLRGMSDYRIGYKADARHWLSVAKAYEDRSPGVLPADWKARTHEALAELNEVVYTQGTSALPTVRQGDADVNRVDPSASGAKAGEDASKDVPAQPSTK